MPDRIPIAPSMASNTWRGSCEKTSLSDYIWLSYSLFFFIEPVIRNRRVYWIESALVYVPFVLVYVLFVQARRIRSQILLLVAMAALGFAGFSFNGGSSSLLTLAAAFLPFVLENVAAILLCFFGLALAVVVEGLLVHENWINIGIALFLIAVVGSSNIFIGQRKRANARLSLAQDEIERLAAISERERIARDLHDVLGHTLSVIVLKSELAGRLLSRDLGLAAVPGAASLPSTAAALKEIADVEQTARKALAEVREAIGGYRAHGLPAEIDQAHRTLAAAGVTLNAELPTPLQLSATQETVLSLAVREAVTNVIRHARASTCEFHLSTAASGDLILLIQDNGGANHARSSSAHDAATASTRDVPPREGNGLRGMRERVEALGGQLTLATGMPGTFLRILLPNSTPEVGPDAHPTVIHMEAKEPRTSSPTPPDPHRTPEALAQ